MRKLGAERFSVSTSVCDDHNRDPNGATNSIMVCQRTFSGHNSELSADRSCQSSSLSSKISLVPFNNAGCNGVFLMPVGKRWHSSFSCRVGDQKSSPTRGVWQCVWVM